MILWLTENYFPNTGGMAQSCDRIVQGLRDAGLEIGLVHFRNTKSKEKFKVVKNGFNLIFPVGDDEGHCYNLLYNYLTNHSNQFQFSSIVAFGGYLPLLGAPVISKLLKLKLVSFLRGNDFDLALFSPKKREILYYALTNSEAICVVSQEHAHKIEKLINHQNIRYIPNGIDLNNWEPHKSELDRAMEWKTNHVPENKKIIGVFGHLKPKKGIEFFIDSIIRSGKADEIFLLITGEIYPEIKEKLDLSGLQYFISPFLDRFELLAWYPICDAVAIPSFYDGMPNVLLEAGALGIPVIAANTGGMKDVLTDNGTGFLFHPGDMEACANSVVQFLEAEPEKLAKIKNKLKYLIANQYNNRIETENYLKLFNEIENKP
jgi:glycosyltransferase involved in cell wall biosynthesis